MERHDYDGGPGPTREMTAGHAELMGLSGHGGVAGVTFGSEP